MVIKCKPVYNFQSVEFEMEIDPTKLEELNGLFNIYNNLLVGLQKVAPEQPVQAKPIPIKQEPKATPGQVQCLVNFGIEKSVAEKMTKAEAGKKIGELCNK